MSDRRKDLDLRGVFQSIGTEIGGTVEQKNEAYGSSFIKCGQFLELLYPDGMRPEQYTKALLLVRIFDKQMRIAHSETAFGESPFRDIAGYGICGASMSPDKERKNDRRKNTRKT